MKILIISPYYRPYINPRAHRWTSIAEHWARQGHDIDIVCSSDLESPKFEILNGVKVYRTGYNSLKEIIYHLFRNKNKRGIADVSSQKKGRGGVLMQWINDKILKKVYFPDDAFVWYLPACRLAKKLIKNEEYDAIISSSVPFTAHLVALFLHKIKPNIKWIADTSDPFAFQPLHPMNNYSLYGRWNKKLEQKVVEKATKITLTNVGAVSMYTRLFPAYKEKFEVIYPLFNPQNDNIIEGFSPPEKAILSTEIHVGYFGSFFRKIREPKPVLHFFREFIKTYPEYKTKLKIHFYGNIFDNFLQDFESYSSLKENSIIHGLVSRGEVEEEMQKMDFLINIGNATAFQLPSKSVDYKASRKPIINFCSIEKDSFQLFFKNYSLIENVKLYKENRKAEEGRLLDFILKKRGKIEEGVNLELYQKEKIGEAYLKIISS